MAVVTDSGDRGVEAPKTWMDLEDVMISGISQIGKDKYHLISLICEI